MNASAIASSPATTARGARARPSGTALVIGGGPAGSAVALLLARAGWHVTLVEQHRFPRDKVCGECLSALGFDVLSRLGLAKSFLQAGAVPLHHTTLYPVGGEFISLRMPACMWGLSRAALDQLLLDASRNEGATIRQPARCEWHGQVGAISLRDLVTNRCESVCASWVICASGGSMPGHAAAKPSGDFGIKTHFENVAAPRDGIALFSSRQTYGGLAPIENGRWNAAFSVPQSMLRHYGGDTESLFATIVAGNAALGRALADAKRVAPWRASPLPRFGVAGSWPAGVIPVGNAAAAIEPIGGEGMGLALRSAEIAVAAVLDGDRSAPAQTQRRIASEYRKLWRRRRFGCRAAGVVVSSSRLSRLLVPAGTAPPEAFSPIWAWLGKTNDLSLSQDS